VAYGGHEEIADAARAMLREAMDNGASPRAIIAAVTPERIGRHRYLAGRPEPDLIIRTSGDRLPAVAERIQRILLLRRALAGVPQTDILRAVRAFQQRRRYGR
jgi:short-chain Z-isoprenyl diphosphate synthase